MLADDDDAEQLFQLGLAQDLTRWPWPRARIQLAYGNWLRRKRRPAESREPLRSALATFDLIGAAGWADQARTGLRAAGERGSVTTSAAPESLMTAQEMQIARPAAEGLSNREIVQRLYLTPRTVGSHLYLARAVAAAGLIVVEAQALSRGSVKPSGARTAGPGRDSRTAVILRRHVAHGLGELPSMACHVLHGAVPFAILTVCGRFEHACSVRTGTLELCTNVLDPDPDEVRHLLVLHGLPAPAFSNDQCTFCADTQLRPVTLAYPRALSEAERCTQPRHCSPHIRIGQNGDDGNWRDRSVELHLPDLGIPHAIGTAAHGWVVLPVASRRFSAGRSDLDRASYPSPDRRSAPGTVTGKTVSLDLAHQERQKSATRLHDLPKGPGTS